MIKLTLVKALNGIYFHTVKIGDSKDDTKYGTDVHLQGPESRSQELQGDHFILDRDHKVCRWHGTNASDCHTTDPDDGTLSTSVIKHEGQFLYTKRKNTEDNTEVNLFDCQFGDKIRLSSKKFVNEVLDANYKVVPCVYQSTEVEKNTLVFYRSGKPLDHSGRVYGANETMSPQVSQDWFCEMDSVKHSTNKADDTGNTRRFPNLFSKYFL